MNDAKNPFTTKFSGAPECALCGVSGGTVQLHQCRICHRRFCDNCAFHSRTGLFCSTECAQRFFLGDLEYEDEDDVRDEDFD